VESEYLNARGEGVGCFSPPDFYPDWRIAMTIRVIVEMEVVQLGVDEAGDPRLWLTSAPRQRVVEWIKDNLLADRLVVRGACNALPEDFAADFPLADDHTWIRIHDRLEPEAGIRDPLMPAGERLRTQIDHRFGCCTVEVVEPCQFTSQPLEDEVLRFLIESGRNKDQTVTD